jgi:hypothetical protein
VSWPSTGGVDIVVVVGLGRCFDEGEKYVCNPTTSEVLFSAGTRKQPEMSPFNDWCTAFSADPHCPPHEVLRGALGTDVVVAGAVVFVELPHAASASADATINAPYRTAALMRSLIGHSIPHGPNGTPPGAQSAGRHATRTV